MPCPSTGIRVAASVGELEAYWEVHLEPISDVYTPSEIPALDLFRE